MKVRIIRTQTGHTEEHTEGDTLEAIAEAAFPGCKGMDLFTAPWTNPEVDVIIVRDSKMGEAGRICAPVGTWQQQSAGKPLGEPRPGPRTIAKKAAAKAADDKAPSVPEGAAEAALKAADDAIAAVKAAPKKRAPRKTAPAPASVDA